LSSAGIVGDQESDTFDLFGTAQQLGTHFLVRTRAGLLADSGPETVIENAEARGKYPLRLRRGRWAAAGMERFYADPFEGPPAIKPPALT
jgi:hypothetical protein